MKKTLIFILTVLACQSYFSQVPVSGLLAYYPFSGNANDASGHNIHPSTINNVTLTADVCGNPNSAYLFNGLNSYIELPVSQFVGLDQYSYCFWIKASPQATTGHGVPISVGESSFGYGQAVTLNSANFLFAGSYNYGTNPLQSYVTSSTLTLNHWHYVVMTRDSNSVKLYVDGVQTATVFNQYTNGQTANYGTNLPFRATIGCRSLSTYYFNGAIDEVRVYNRVLTPSEVYGLYKSCCPITISPSLSTICEGDGINLTASGAATFFWSNGTNGSINSVSPTINSVYTVTNTAQDCPTINTCTVNVLKCTGIANYAQSVEKWFPNPSNGIIECFLYENTLITITDMYGKVVYQVKTTLNGHHKIDVSNLSLKTGVYFITTRSGSQELNQKLILTN